jgi:hypothetical protein
MDQINGTQSTKLNLWYLYSNRYILPQHKLFSCGYVVLKWTVTVTCGISLTVHRTGIELYTSLMAFKTFSAIQWSSIHDWLFATVMHVPRIVCVCYSTVNIG